MNENQADKVIELLSDIKDLLSELKDEVSDISGDVELIRLNTFSQLDNIESAISSLETTVVQKD